MKTFNYFAGSLSAALLALFAAGCTDADTFGTGQQPMEITADTDASIRTRSEIDTESEFGTTGILWSAGDRIGVFGSQTTNAAFTGNNTVAAPTATFAGSMATGDKPLYAYYPYAESNAGAAARSVAVSIGSTQAYTGPASIAANDIKVSNAPVQRDGQWHFSFRPVVTLLRFAVDARGVQGVDASAEKLTAIQVKAVSEGAAPIAGDFTIDLTDGASQLVSAANNTATAFELNLNPTALSGKVDAYACIAPSVQKGEKLQISLATDKHWVSLTVVAAQTLQAGGCYTVPLVLANATDDNGLQVEDIGDRVKPSLFSFSFLAANNTGKILSKEAYYDSAKGTQTRTLSGHDLAVSDDEGTVTGCIPYLYDFRLKPTFTATDGATVTVKGVAQTSGESEQDFSQPVTYTVTNKAGTMSRDYVVTVTNTGLPVVVLTGNSGGTKSFLGMSVPAKEADFTALDKIAIYDQANPANNFAEAACGFRLRGNSTQAYPKKPFAIKLDKKAAVLGMPKHKRWCLLASWIDRSLIRNAVVFDIAKRVQDAFPSTPDASGFYGSEGTNGLVWNPSGKNVELVMNGVHVGNYFLCEQIKIDENRLAIQDGFEDVKSPTTANCGYLLEFDDNYDEPTKYTTTKGNLPCMSKDDMSNGGSSIWSYVTGYVQDIENNLWIGNYTAAYDKLDINSVIDYWFVQELSMNDEFKHPKSVYMYKNGEGKLFAGPVWDFDWQTFPNIDNITKWDKQYVLDYDYNTLLVSKYQYASSIGNLNGDRPYLWYPKLFNDPNFKARAKERWGVVYPKLAAVVNTISELGQANKLSDSFNQAMWPSESYERSSWGISTAYSGDERLTYDEAIESMKTVYSKRLNALNRIISAW